MILVENKVTTGETRETILQRDPLAQCRNNLSGKEL